MQGMNSAISVVAIEPCRSRLIRENSKVRRPSLWHDLKHARPTGPKLEKGIPLLYAIGLIQVALTEASARINMAAAAA